MSDTLGSFRATVALDLMTLALLHDRELEEEAIVALKADGFPRCLGLRLESEPGRAALSLLEAAVEHLEANSQERDELAADFAAIYLNHGYGAAPCESVWIDEDGLTMQEPMFQVREFYARHGLCAPNWRMRTDDHLVHQLHFLTELLGREEPTLLPEAARFLDEHTLRWLPDFARRVSTRAATPFYAGLALLTAAYLDEFRDLVAKIQGQPRPTPEEIERRMKPQRETVVPMPSTYVPGSAPSW